MKSNASEATHHTRLSPTARAFAGIAAGFLAAMATPAPAEDVGFIAVIKGQEFHQTSAHVVALGEWKSWHRTGEVQNEGEQEEPVHVFEAFVAGNAPGVLLAASVTPPVGPQIPMSAGDDPENPELGFEAGAATPLELDTAWPDGPYTVAVNRLNDGPLAITLDLTGGTSPPVPQVIDFDALQAANATTNRTLKWTPMGGDASDFILLQIHALSAGDDDDDDGTVFSTGMPGMSDALNGTHTQAQIPAGTLMPGRDYHGELIFVKTNDFTTTPALAIAGHYKMTGFRIRTAALPGASLDARFLRGVPANGHLAPRDTVVALHFSHPMSTHPAHRSVSWTNDGAPFSPAVDYHWTSDSHVLLCEFQHPLPANRRIAWALAGFRDQAGFPADATAGGWFQTGDQEPETPPDIGFIGLFKSREFIQSGGAPVPTGRHEATAEVETHAPNRLMSATFIAMADSSARPLFADPWSGDEYKSPGEYGSNADLDRFWPNGAYIFTFGTISDGMGFFTLGTGSTDAYPDAPTLSNLADLQTLAPAEAFSINWLALPGWNGDMESLAAGEGFAVLEIIDESGREVFSSWEDGGMTAHSAEIPAGRLEAGRRYSAELVFYRLTDRDASGYPMFGVAGFASHTRFTLQTSGRRLSPILRVERNAIPAILTAIHPEPDTSYVVETSCDLLRWSQLTDFRSPGGHEGPPFGWRFEDWDAQHLKARFYRMREKGLCEPLEVPVAIQGTVWADSRHAVPIPGAIVGSSLDDITTVTDADGCFFLTTDTPSPVGPYTIHVRTGDHSRDFGPFAWGDQPRGQVFEMN